MVIYLKERKDIYQRVNMNYETKSIEELDRLVEISPVFTTRTQLINHIINQYLKEIRNFKLL